MDESEGLTYQSEVSLQQWRTIVAVADEGGLHAAGRRIGRSHSAVSQAIRLAEASLGVTLFERQGRGLRVTEAGQVLARRGRRLLEASRRVEYAARSLAAGWEAEVELAVDGIVPHAWLVSRLRRFGAEGRGTRLRIGHEMMFGAARAWSEGRADIVLSGTMPTGAAPFPVLDLPFHLVATPALAAGLAGPRDVASERQIVVGDTAITDDLRGWLRLESRWTVPSFDLALELVRSGLGIGVVPRSWVEHDLEAGRLVIIDGAPPVIVQVHALSTRGDAGGPAVQLLLRCLRERPE